MVSNYTANGSQATFKLTLFPDSAFATLTGTAMVTVYQQTGTRMRDISAIANGQQLEARGLLFYGGGSYKIIASCLKP